jgi:hypothetical protein
MGLARRSWSRGVRSFGRLAGLLLPTLLSAACAEPIGLSGFEDGFTASDEAAAGQNTADAPGATGGSGGGTAWTQATGTPLPCDVSRAVIDSCQGCHGATPIGGAPMPLVTHEDFARDYTAQTTPSAVGQSFKVHQLARMRLNDASAPMPPGRNITQTDFEVIDAWLASGAPAGTEAERTCLVPSSPAAPGTPGTETSDPSDPAGSPDPSGPSRVTTNLCDAASAYEPLVARPGETCYELPIHGGQFPGDTSAYSIRTGEHYQQFYYRAPWPTGSQATRFGARFENLSVLHHWLLFSSAKPVTLDGTHETVIGTQLGDEAQLLAGWAVGGCSVEMPPGVGLELPPEGSLLNVQWHFYNNTGLPVNDRSAVQVCTVPAGTRPNVGSLTWLGTENFFGPLGMPPGPNEFGGTCTNRTNAPITIWSFWPHMHALGRNMRSTVHRVDGTTEEVFNQPFDFNYQVHYDQTPPVVLQPGDSITSTCSFMNETGAFVAFGPSSNQEMCYQFTYAYPARALDNGVPSLIGATNTCW